MKNPLNRLLKSRFGTELAETLATSLAINKKMKSGRFSANRIDQKLEDKLPHRNGFYVELGANDGARESNSYFFELKKGWRGVLVEPAPNLFLKCYKRRGRKNVAFCNACVPFGYEEEFVPMRYGDLLTSAENLPKDIDDQEEFAGWRDRFLSPTECIFDFGAKPATLTSLLEKADAPAEIDFLSLDVEGAELAVLQGVDFAKYSFKYIVVECRDIARLMEYLEPKGYHLLEKITHHDYLIQNNLAL